MVYGNSSCTRIRAAMLGSILLLCAASLPAQRVSPVVVQHQGNAKGRIQLSNDSLRPVDVIIEPVSFTLSEDGDPTFRPLDSHIRVKLSTMSLRIPPKQSRFVFYEAEAEHLPAWFVIYSTFGKAPNANQVNLRFKLPHTVYLLQEERLAESDVRVVGAEYQAETGKVVVTVENNSPRLGRVQEAQIRSGRTRESYGSFPVFPNSRRRFTVPWKDGKTPEEVRLQFGKFTVKSEVEVGDRHGTDADQNLSP